MVVSEAQKKALKKWESEKTDRIALRVPKGKKELISKCAQENKESISGMINRLIDDELKKKNLL